MGGVGEEGRTVSRPQPCTRIPSAYQPDTREGSYLIDLQTPGPVVTMRHTVLLSEATWLLSLVEFYF